jgi:hypothetical protein
MIYFVLIGQFMVYCVQSISRLHHILRTAYALFCGRFMFNGTFVATSTIPSRLHIGYGRSSAQPGPTDCAIVLFPRLHAAPMQPVEFLAVLKSLPAYPADGDAYCLATRNPQTYSEATPGILVEVAWHERRRTFARAKIGNTLCQMDDLAWLVESGRVSR